MAQNKLVQDVGLLDFINTYITSRLLNPQTKVCNTQFVKEVSSSLCMYTIL
jgi:hypothetical protein